MAIFFAKLKRTSTIHSNWRQASKPVGQIAAVTFKYQGNEYVTDELTKSEVDRLRFHIAVHLVAIGAPVSAKPEPAPFIPLRKRNTR